MKQSILIVDDEKLVTWSVGQALSDSGYTVELASSGEEAVAKASEIKFDLIVTDLKMEGINGVETVRQIKDKSPDTKAVIITAYGTEKDVWEARNENIALWMTKPFQMKDLIRYVKNLLSESVSVDVNNMPPTNTPHSSGHHGFNALSILAMIALFLISILFHGKVHAAVSSSADQYSIEYLYSIKDAGTRFEKLNTPFNLYYDKQHQELYVVDLGSKRIYSYDTNGMMVKEWNSFGKVKDPCTVTLDSKGNLYVGDISQPLVVVLNYFGKVVDYINLNSVCTTSTERIQIKKLLMDKEDRLYVGENKGNRILVFDTFTHELIREIGSASDSHANIKALMDMVFDGRGNLEVLDTGHDQVMVFDSKGELIQSFGKGGGGQFTIGLASGISYDAEREWTLVTDATKHAVLCFDKYGECFYEFGALGYGKGYFYFPRGITVDAQHRIYILEPNTARIQVFKINQEPNQKEVQS